jgi:FkbM family methyltransferase
MVIGRRLLLLIFAYITVSYNAETYWQITISPFVWGPPTLLSIKYWTSMMNAKALARFLYANIPGLAAVRFAAKDLAAPYFAKPEFQGVPHLSIGNSLIVDIGANRGQSIEAFKRLAPASRIVAFEPEPRCAIQLESRYRRDPMVTAYGCALGAGSGVLTFFVPKYGQWDCDGMSATDYKEATEWLRDPGRMLLFNEAKLSVKEHPVECRTLDSFGLAPRLVKLHAQGAEFEILKGSQATVEQHRPALMLAFASTAVDALLCSWRYRPYDYRNGYFTPGIAARPRTFTWYLTDDHLSHAPVSG